MSLFVFMELEGVVLLRPQNQLNIEFLLDRFLRSMISGSCHYQVIARDGHRLKNLSLDREFLEQDEHINNLLGNQDKRFIPEDCKNRFRAFVERLLKHTFVCETELFYPLSTQKGHPLISELDNHIHSSAYMLPCLLRYLRDVKRRVGEDFSAGFFKSTIFVFQSRMNAEAWPLIVYQRTREFHENFMHLWNKQWENALIHKTNDSLAVPQEELYADISPVQKRAIYLHAIQRLQGSQHFGRYTQNCVERFKVLINSPVCAKLPPLVLRNLFQAELSMLEHLEGYSANLERRYESNVRAALNYLDDALFLKPTLGSRVGCLLL